MIAKAFTPENRAKPFAIMKHPAAPHDREGFNTPVRIKPFAIMKPRPENPPQPQTQSAKTPASQNGS
jgi:hypothetical protein